MVAVVDQSKAKEEDLVLRANIKTGEEVFKCEMRFLCSPFEPPPES
jgi:hypothetical protein